MGENETIAKRASKKQHITRIDMARRNHRTKRVGLKQQPALTNDWIRRNHRPKRVGPKQHPAPTKDRVRRNHVPLENWNECSIIFLRKETDVGAKGGALYETKRTGEARQSQNNAKLKNGQSTRINLPPITLWWPWNTNNRWVFILYLTKR